jgi:hypothetical protein
MRLDKNFCKSQVICPTGRFVEPIEKIDFHVHGLLDQNFCVLRPMDAGIQSVGQITAVPPPSLRGALATMQSIFLVASRKVDCFAALAMTADYAFGTNPSYGLIEHRH